MSHLFYIKRGFDQMRKIIPKRASCGPVQNGITIGFLMSIKLRVKFQRDIFHFQNRDLLRQMGIEGENPLAARKF